MMRVLGLTTGAEGTKREQDWKAFRGSPLHLLREAPNTVVVATDRCRARRNALYVNPFMGKPVGVVIERAQQCIADNI